MTIHQAEGRNVNETLTEALWKVKVSGVREESRNGAVYTVPQPVLIITHKPEERVLFCERRKENPFFHFMECLWMMAGSDDVAWISYFNPRMVEYAEANGKIHGAYGHRWRKRFNVDQVMDVAELLQMNPTTRRAVINMWSAQYDLGSEAKDIPCNTQIYFRIVNGALDMTVLNRSNDLIWGALGSNIVHFSFLQELIATEIGRAVGKLYQFTNNLHVYERHWEFLDIPPHCEGYEELKVTPHPIMNCGNLESWLRMCEDFVIGRTWSSVEPFFFKVVSPIFNAWETKDPKHLDDCAASDWALACRRYLARVNSGVGQG